MMKIVAVMSMRNEADIVETWVRYYVEAVDHIIITDNMSVDGSGDILQELIAEGLPISVEVDNRPAHFQEERMQKMMRRAFLEFEADWVLLLDADEFLIPPAGRTLRDIFGKLKKNRLLKVAWTTYIPTESDPDEPNILKRVSHRLENEVKRSHKVMVPAKIGKKAKAVIKMGNHGMRIGRRRVDTQRAPSGMSLAHFPVRSKEQLATKILVGRIASLARSNYTEGEGYHQKILFDRFFENKGEAFSDLKEMAVNYFGSGKEEHESPRIINGPIEDSLSDFTIKYSSDSICTPLRVFASTAEDIASNCGKLTAQVTTIRSSPKAAFKNFLATLIALLPGRK